MVVPIVIIRVRPAAAARFRTSSSWEASRGSVRWQWESITSERGFKRVRRVANLRLLTVGPHHRDHVEAGRRLRDAVAVEVVPRGFRDLVALEAVDLRFRRRGRVVDAGLDLAEHQRTAVAGDDVDLAQRAAEVADQNLVAALAEVAGGAVLAAVAERVLRGRTARRLPPSLE